MSFTSKPLSASFSPTGTTPPTPSFAPGDYDINISAYMKTEKGNLSPTNFDNFYMNGMFVKSFKFTDLTKNVESIEPNGVFAVSNGLSTDNASKLIFNHLDSMRSYLTSSTSLMQMKSRLREVIISCNNILLEEGRKNNTSYGASLAISVYYMDTIIYAVCGTGSLFFAKKGRVSKKQATNPYLGVGPMGTVNIATKRFSQFDRTILCSEGVCKLPQVDSFIYGAVNKITPKEIIDSLFSQMQYYPEINKTCMAVSASPTVGITTRTLVIAGICLLITVLNAVFLILR